jgi:hypothetical protein
VNPDDFDGRYALCPVCRRDNVPLRVHDEGAARVDVPGADPLHRRNVLLGRADRGDQLVGILGAVDRLVDRLHVRSRVGHGGVVAAGTATPEHVGDLAVELGGGLGHAPILPSGGPP